MSEVRVKRSDIILFCLQDLPVEIEHFPHYRHHLRFSLVNAAAFDIKN